MGNGGEKNDRFNLQHSKNLKEIDESQIFTENVNELSEFTSFHHLQDNQAPSLSHNVHDSDSYAGKHHEFDLAKPSRLTE